MRRHALALAVARLGSGSRASAAAGGPCGIRMTHYDACVVGLGAHGSAALYHLAKRGLHVLGLEQHSVGHDRGSSHGLSRIIRLAYHEGSDYVPLLRRAYELWRELQAESGLELLTLTGSVEASDPAAPPEHNCFASSLAAAREHGLAHEVLSAEQVNARFPGYRLPAHWKAVYQPEGGILAPERCVQAHVAGARRAGAEVHEGEAVQGWCAEADGGVSVTTGRGMYRARRLVLTCGAWLPQLLPAFQGALTVQRQVVAWFEARRPEHFAPASFPVFILQDERLGYFYGFPSYGHEGLKIGKFYHLGEIVEDPARVKREISSEDEEALRCAVREYFPEADGAMTHPTTCMFTNTEDRHFLIDAHPKHEQVIICSACSGHGFKFASVVGEALAELAAEGATRHPIAMHRLDARRPGQAQLLAALRIGPF